MKNRGKAGCLGHMGGPRSRAAAALALAALLSAGALRAATETVGGRTWTYRAAGGAAEVVPAGGGRCAVSPAPSGRLAVPATLGGLPVAGVGASAFRDCAGLEDVALPATVTNIGAEAFLGCAGLTNVLVPARWVRIGVRAFEGCVELAGVGVGPGGGGGAVAAPPAPPRPALPCTQEVARAEAAVRGLTEADRAAVRNGWRTHAEFAETLLGYVRDAETAAERYVLLRDAFGQYLAGCEFPRALGAFRRLGGAVGAPPEGELARWAAPSVPDLVREGRADGLAALLDAAALRGDLGSATQLVHMVRGGADRLGSGPSGPAFARALARARELGDLRLRLLSLRPAAETNAAARAELARCLAASGDWKAALAAFARSSGPEAAVAAWELAYPGGGASGLTPARVADFWWRAADAAPEGSLAGRALRLHAADWYRAALADGTLAGLAGKLAERRVREARNLGPADWAEAAARTGPGPAWTGRPLALPLGPRVMMELVPCPAGSFTMGYEGGRESYRPRPVRISRPFWAGRYPVTREQWNVFMPPQETNELEAALGGDRGAVGGVDRAAATRFCGILTEKFGHLLPHGYVFRLPTLAEYEYLTRANTVDPKDPYSSPTSPQAGGARHSEIAVGPDGKEELLRRCGLTLGKWSTQGHKLPTVRVGLRRPNRWGIYDCLGNADTWVLDLFPKRVMAGERWMKLMARLPYPDPAVDPLAWEEGGDLVGVIPLCHWFRAWGEVERFYVPRDTVARVLGLRVVAAPDLVAELRARKGL